MGSRDSVDRGARSLSGGEVLRLDDPLAGHLQLYATGRSTAISTPLVLVHSVNAAASAHEVRPLYDHYGGTRPTYALDLPGFGGSDRSERRYTPQLMTHAILAAIAHVRRFHHDAPVDALGLSLSCEFLARAAYEEPSAFRTLALVSPTGVTGTRRLDGPPGTNRGSKPLYAVLTVPLWRRALFRLLTRPRVIRYFLARTFGSPTIDEQLWADAVRVARRPGAEHAPLDFVSGFLFSADITRIYEGLQMPVWVGHGIRGDFVDYQGLEPLLGRDHWSRRRFETGAMPYFEQLRQFTAAYDEFLGRSPAPTP